jgi:hypothetical protein
MADRLAPGNLGADQISWRVAIRSCRAFPFNTANVCDFRDDSLYLHAMNRDFPTRFVTVVGLRKDNTFRAFGPIKRSESAPFVESLRRTNEFETIALVHVRPERAVR